MNWNHLEIDFQVVFVGGEYPDVEGDTRMKPDYLTDEEYKRLMAQVRKDISADPSVSMMAMLTPSLYDLGAAGIWLEEQVKKEGGAEGLSFALGQACFPSREPWATAKAMLDRWRAGRVAEPGAAFGDELLTGDVSDLPPGGLRIVRA